MRTSIFAISAVAAFALTSAYGDASAQTPKRGGTVIVGYESGDPATTDCHAGPATNAVAVYTTPHYSTLLRYDIHNYPKLEGDAAESWTVSPDGLTYTFKLRPNIKFHDGTPLTSADVKASYDRIRNPPEGIVSVRKLDYANLASVEAPAPDTVVFKLSQPEAVMLNNFASPFNCIYSARLLAQDQKYPATKVMGSGPFMFDEFVKGQMWTAKRFDGYFRPGQPYLDYYKIVQVSAGGGCARAFAGGQVDACLRTMSPQEIETTRVNRGERSTYFTIPIVVETFITFNSSRKPFDDARVRRALTLAIDRRGGITPLKVITNQLQYGTIIRPGSDFALSEAELAQQPGFGTDPNAARAEARKLLAEAGQSNLKFTMLNRQINPNEQLGIFAVDQWRQIGVTVDVRMYDAGNLLALLGKGDFDATIDTNPALSEDPSSVLAKFAPGAGTNFGRYEDKTLVDLYAQQRVMLDPVKRKALVNQFEKRVLNEAYVAPLFWPGWSAVVNSSVKGWEPTPLYHVGWDLGGMWRAD